MSRALFCAYLLLGLAGCGRLGYAPLIGVEDADGGPRPLVDFDPLSCTVEGCLNCSGDTCCLRDDDDFRCPRGGCNCYTTCPDFGGCGIECYENSQCYTDCVDKFFCTVNCGDSALCVVDCTRTPECRLFMLSEDAAGVLICTDSPGICEIRDCADQVSCADGVVVCNRGCP